VSAYDVAIVGVPFDSGTSFRPGARFGPIEVRTSSRHLRPAYHPELGVSPFDMVQVVDAGDIACTPFSITEAMAQVEPQAREIAGTAARLIAIGGDHTIAFPLLRGVVARHGPVALLHFDAHLDTWDTYFNAPLTHGTVLRRAFEDGLLIEDHSIHVGIRGPIYDALDLQNDRDFGFKTIRTSDLMRIGLEAAAEQIRERLDDLPVYLSVDIDVLDPAFAPGTGTPESGGLQARELLGLLRRLDGLNLVGADVVEVAPAYDHAQITTLAAATVVFDIASLMARTG
jgi:agmatinase